MTLVERRRELGMSAKRVAQLCGIDFSEYLRMELGKKQIPAIKAKILAYTLRLSIEEIFELIVQYKQRNELN